MQTLEITELTTPQMLIKFLDDKFFITGNIISDAENNKHKVKVGDILMKDSNHYYIIRNGIRTIIEPYSK